MPSTQIFPLGKIATSDDVVDRREFIQETKLRLLNGNSVMLSGPRRTGKSSVSYEIIRQLQLEGCYTASVDLLYVNSIEELAAKLIQSILENRVGLLSQVPTVFRHLKEILSNSKLHAKIQDLDLGITFNGQKSPLELLETAIFTAEKMAEKDNKRMVILFDEFQELDRLGDDSLLKRLRSIFQHQERTSYYFLGSESSLLNTIFADRRQAFYRFATLITLPSIPNDEWKQYITTKLNNEHIDITDSAFSLLIGRTGGHPYCVMSVILNAYYYAKVNNTAEINAEVLNFAYEQSMTQLNIVYEDQWQQIRKFKGSDKTVLSILTGNPLYKKDDAVANVNRAIKNLTRLSIIEKGENRGEYHILEPMFGDWILRKTTTNN